MCAVKNTILFSFFFHTLCFKAPHMQTAITSYLALALAAISLVVSVLVYMALGKGGARVGVNHGSGHGPCHICTRERSVHYHEHGGEPAPNEALSGQMCSKCAAAPGQYHVH